LAPGSKATDIMGERMALGFLGIYLVDISIRRVGLPRTGLDPNYQGERRKLGLDGKTKATVVELVLLRWGREAGESCVAAACWIENPDGRGKGILRCVARVASEGGQRGDRPGPSPLGRPGPWSR
jgi:hypothetical protein